MAGTNKYITITTEGTGDFRDRGSKFLSFSYPVSTINEVKEKLQLLKKEHPKANHHCYAYRVGIDGNQFRANDDGEPPGSSGKPILGQIDTLGLTNVLVVVVRYFGGSLLGIPGLINAYRAAASLSLENLPTTERWIEKILVINFDYSAMGEVLYLLKQADATIYRQDLMLFCTIRAGLPKIYADTYMHKLSEIRSVVLTQEVK